MEIWSAAFLHNNAYANYNQMRSPKDWTQHFGQLRARAKDIVRTGIPVHRLVDLTSTAPNPTPKRKCANPPKRRAATYEQVETVFLATLSVFGPQLTRSMTKPTDAWRGFDAAVQEWIVDRRERLDDADHECVLDYTEFPLLATLLCTEAWDDEDETSEDDDEVPELEDDDEDDDCDDDDDEPTAGAPTGARDIFSLILKLPMGDRAASMRGRESTTVTGKAFWELMRSRTKAGKTGDTSYFDGLTEAEQTALIETVTRVNTEKSACPFLFRVLTSQMPDSVKNTVLTRYENSRSESQGTKYTQWVEGLLAVPFGVHHTPKHFTPEVLTSATARKAFFADARKTLHKAVYGHEEAKGKLVQFFAQLTRRAMVATTDTTKAANGLVLGIQGPPGNGKTTLVEKGVSQVLGLPFVSIPLGGATDASVLYGHSYTYEGSVWGQIADVMMKAKCMNPIVYLDELDKVSDTSKGQEIVSLLCNMTDPSQNHQFKDRYFGNINIDLSKVTWVFSYNDRSAIHPVLRDRITEVQTKGFTLPQKQTIVRDFLVPEMCAEIGMPAVSFADDIVAHLIDRHTYEGGVRKIKELLVEVCRNLNEADLVGTVTLANRSRRKAVPYAVTREQVDTYLEHKTPALKERVHTTSIPGRINGLYASCGTDMGGIIQIETKLVPSNDTFGIVLTGNLGKVMKESATVAKTLALHCLTPDARATWEKRWKDVKESVHVHCPEGAVSKDGPSAGTALTVAILSLLTNNPIRSDVALTGEMNLSGEVTAIGGLRSKLYGAKSAGCCLALFPKDNLPSYEQIVRECPDLFDDTFEARPVGTLGEVVAQIMDTYDGVQMDAITTNGPVSTIGSNKRRRPDRAPDKAVVGAKRVRAGVRTRGRR